MRLVDADVIRDTFDVMDGDDDTLCECITIIDYSPTIDPVKHGMWAKYKCGDFEGRICNSCAAFTITEDDWHKGINRYCRNCGALMDEEIKEFKDE